MQHHNPYSGKRKGERYVKLDKVERDSLERVANVAADIGGSRHASKELKMGCVDLNIQAKYLLDRINEANEISLLPPKPVQEESPKEDPKKIRGK